MRTKKRAAVRSRRWTKAEYYRLGELRFFDGQRVELLEGRILVQSPMTPLHAGTMMLIRESFRPFLPEGYQFRGKSPLDLGKTTEPEPDFAIVQGADREYMSAHPDDRPPRHRSGRYLARLRPAAQGKPVRADGDRGLLARQPRGQPHRGLPRSDPRRHRCVTGTATARASISSRPRPSRRWRFRGSSFPWQACCLEIPPTSARLADRANSPRVRETR